MLTISEYSPKPQTQKKIIGWQKRSQSKKLALKSQKLRLQITAKHTRQGVCTLLQGDAKKLRNCKDKELNYLTGGMLSQRHTIVQPHNSRVGVTLKYFDTKELIKSC